MDQVEDLMQSSNIEQQSGRSNVSTLQNPLLHPGADRPLGELEHLRCDARAKWSRISKIAFDCRHELRTSRIMFRERSRDTLNRLDTAEQTERTAGLSLDGAHDPFHASDYARVFRKHQAPAIDRPLPGTSIQYRRVRPSSVSRTSSRTPPLRSIVRAEATLLSSQVTSTRSIPRTRANDNTAPSAQVANPWRRAAGRTE